MIHWLLKISNDCQNDLLIVKMIVKMIHWLWKISNDG